VANGSHSGLRALIQVEIGHWYGLNSGLLDDFTITPGGDWCAAEAHEHTTEQPRAR
jgi:hypothetical protein